MGLVAALAAAASVIGPAFDGTVSYAPVGGRAVYAVAEGREVRVLSRPLAGGRPRLVDRVRIPARRVAFPQLVASDRAVALRIQTEDLEGALREEGVFSGRAGGPLKPLIELRARERFNLVADVDRHRVFVETIDPSPFRVTHALYGRGGVRLPAGPPPGAQGARYAGAFSAYWTRRGLTLTRGRTILRRHRHDLDWPFALRADGTLAFGREGELRVAVRGGAPRRLAGIDTYGGSLDWAGRRLAAEGGDSVAIVDPDGSVRRLARRAGPVSGVVASPRAVLWQSGGKVRAASAG